GAIAGGPLSGDIAPLYVGHALDGPGGGRYRRPFVVMLAAPVGDTRRFPRALVIGALLLAPVVLLGWTVIGPRPLGSDYLHYPISGPRSRRFYPGGGLEPMWYPHQTGGIPIGGLFYGQYFHLPAWILSQLPGFWNGELLRWLAVRHLLLLALAQA